MTLTGEVIPAQRRKRGEKFRGVDRKGLPGGKETAISSREDGSTRLGGTGGARSAKTLCRVGKKFFCCKEKCLKNAKEKGRRERPGGRTCHVGLRPAIPNQKVTPKGH